MEFDLTYVVKWRSKTYSFLFFLRLNHKRIRSLNFVRWAELDCSTLVSELGSKHANYQEKTPNYFATIYSVFDPELTVRVTTNQHVDLDIDIYFILSLCLGIGLDSNTISLVSILTEDAATCGINTSDYVDDLVDLFSVTAQDLDETLGTITAIVNNLDGKQSGEPATTAHVEQNLSVQMKASTCFLNNVREALLPTWTHETFENINSCCNFWTQSQLICRILPEQRRFTLLVEFMPTLNQVPKMLW